MQLLGAPAYRRHPVALRRVVPEIVVEQPFESRQRIFVDVAARGELPFVEPDAVIEQQLDVRDDQRPAVLVDGVLQFARDVLQAVDHDMPLLFREVQRLVGFVGEEGVAVDAASERRAADQVGVEQQRPAFGLENLAVILDADHLSRGRENERPFLVVVVVAPVAQVAAFDIFQEDAVEPVQAARVTHARAFRHVDDADQRVQGFDSHQFVILVHMIQPCDLFHSCSGLFDTKLVFFSSLAAPAAADR